MQLQFTNKYVAFLDVLGFSALVNSNENEKLNEYFTLVEMAFDLFDDDKKNIQKLAISDSIILIANDNEADLRILLKAIRTLQYSLAINDIWLRGGIAYGEVYYNEETKTIVGKGFIKAYLLENEAVYPRVILDPSILKHLGLTRTELYHKFNGAAHQGVAEDKLLHDYGVWAYKRHTNDDAIFVSYAHGIVHESLVNQTDRKENNIETIYKHLRTNLYGSQQHYAKYLWLKKYFQETILEFEHWMIRGERFHKTVSDFSNL